MKFIDIAIKDLYQLFNDWKPALFLLILPILFTLMFGFMFGGFGGPNAETDSRLPVQIVLGEKTSITDSIVGYLEESSAIKLTLAEPNTDLASVKQAVSEGEIAGALVIPAGFSENVTAGNSVTLEVILDENTTAGVTVQQAVESAAIRVQSAADTAATAAALYADREGFADDAARNAFYNDAFDTALAAWESPSVRAEETQTAPQGSQSTSEENAFAQSLPGMMAQFAIAGLMGAAELIIQERKSGALDRILSTAVPKFSVLIGHWLAMFVMIFLQFIVLVIFGQVFLRLDFFAAPGATLVLSVASCAFVASLGLLIGILAKMPEQSAVYALIPMFVFSGLGGAWVPLDILGEQVQKVSRFTPVYWIMTGFRDVLLRGARLGDVGWPTAALFGFALLFFVPAVVLFYRKRH
ncbi:ABC transporter permease [bacterium]|nr:ABC transporter permease [bacterium]